MKQTQAMSVGRVAVVWQIKTGCLAQGHQTNREI
jgi:hypothetical protein